MHSGPAQRQRERSPVEFCSQGGAAHFSRLSAAAHCQRFTDGVRKGEGGLSEELNHSPVSKHANEKVVRTGFAPDLLHAKIFASANIDVVEAVFFT